MQTVKPQKIGDGLAGNRDIEAYLKYKFVPAIWDVSRIRWNILMMIGRYRN